MRTVFCSPLGAAQQALAPEVLLALASSTRQTSAAHVTATTACVELRRICAAARRSFDRHGQRIDLRERGCVASATPRGAGRVLRA
jgi:hypothetical protein